MKFKNKNISARILLMYASGLLVIVLSASCRKFLAIPLPVDNIAGDGAFISDVSASGVVSGVYYSMYSYNVFSGGPSVGYESGLYTDELRNLDPGSISNQSFYTDNINSTMAGEWTALYKLMYASNTAVTGISTSKATLINKNKWLGEALFTRAFLYFYLVNIYGDVPLTTTADYNTNNKLARSPKALVYAQMVADLQQAESFLGADYHDGFGAVTTDRTRPNQFAASALLARVYLYTGEWAKAEAEATKVISNASYELVTPDVAFLAASKESIWSLAPTKPGYVTEFGLYNNNMPAVIAPPKDVSSYVSASMSQSLVNKFEPGDARFTNWVRSSTVSASATTTAQTYYFPNKYKSNLNGTEYIVMLRLAEQYLIRAEARAQLGNTDGAKADLNMVRTRAGLSDTTASTKETLLTAIAKERQTELFTELGNRFFDLKRTNTIDAVMNVEAPLKGGTWDTRKQIWPIPSGDIVVDPNLTQAPGYQE